MKKVTGIIVVSLVMSFCVNVLPINAEEKEILVTEQDMEVFRNLGFTDEEIYQMDQEEYDLNINLEGGIVSEETKFLKVVEDIEDLATFGIENQKVSRDITDESIDDTNVIELDKATYWKEVEEQNIEEQNNNAETRATNQPARPPQNIL